MLEMPTNLNLQKLHYNTEIKKAARFVTDLDNNHSGVGDFLQKHVL